MNFFTQNHYNLQFKDFTGFRLICSYNYQNFNKSGSAPTKYSHIEDIIKNIFCTKLLSHVQCTDRITFL